MNTLFEMPEPKTKNEAIIRALWWNQPYASLMLPPFDKDETRNRKTNVRGVVLICACKREYEYGKVIEISGYQVSRITAALQVHFSCLPLGKAIAIGELVDCYPMKLEHEDKCYVQYKAGLWVWKFENIQPIEPFEIKGKQGWSILTDEEKAKIKLTPQTNK